MTAIQRPAPKGLFVNPAYAHAIVATGTHIYISGQVAMDEQGKLVGGSDLAAQTEQVMKNLGLALGAAGATFADVVKIVTYVVGYKTEHRAVIGAVRGKFFVGGEPPASTLVGVTSLALPDWLIEIEAVAVVAAAAGART